MDLSIRQAWALHHPTGTQYSFIKWTKARAAVQSTIASAPQLDPAYHFRTTMPDICFLHIDSQCWRNISALYSFIRDKWVQQKTVGLFVDKDVKLMLCLLVKMEGCQHSLCCTGLELPFVKVGE